MADSLSTSNTYKMLGGINQKASKYEMSTAQFLDLRNLDFDVPNALQKRPGSTYAIGSDHGTSGPITSLFEFSKLTGQSYIIAGSDTAMFYVNGTSYSLISAGWTNGQPTDMLTFINKLWMCNGQNWATWDGSSYYPAGLPLSPIYAYGIGATLVGSATTYGLFNQNFFASASNVTYMLVGGATVINKGVSWLARGVFVAYSYIRNDGYYGPIDFLKSAVNVVANTVTAGTEFFSGGTTITFVDGFTVPSGYGISAIALWVGVDTANVGSTSAIGVNGAYLGKAGNLGYVADTGGVNAHHQFASTLLPSADLTRFHLFTTVPTSNLFQVNLSAGGNSAFAAYGTTFVLSDFSVIDGVAGLGLGWSGMTSDFFATFTPKYQDINQNTMFISGFSSSPSTVKFSEVGEPEVYMPENTIEVRTNDGDRVFAQKAFNNTMVFCKEHSFAKLVGDNADNFQLVELSTDFGCLSNNTMLTKDQTMFWLDRKGILEYTGANWRIASDAVENIFRRMNISAAKEKAVGVHHMSRNQLWWGIPIDGATQNNITVVFDYLINAWTFFDGFNPASFAYNKGYLTKQTAWRGDYSGMIHYFSESLFADSGQGITCLGFTRYENVGGENQTTLWRRFFLDVATVTGNTGVINGQVFSNYNNSSIQATFAMYQDQFQSRAEMGIMGKAVAAQFSHSSASLPLLINGYSWASRGLRNV